MKNADENELRSIASDPDEIHMYNVNDFQFLLDIVDDLTINLCNSVKGPGRKRATCSVTIKPLSLVESTHRYIHKGFRRQQKEAKVCTLTVVNFACYIRVPSL